MSHAYAALWLSLACFPLTTVAAAVATGANCPVDRQLPVFQKNPYADDMLHITADEVELLANQHARFDGAVSIRGRLLTLDAEHAELSRDAQRLLASGAVTFNSENAVVAAQSVEANIGNSYLAFKDADYQLRSRGGRGQAQEFRVDGKKGLTLTDASFTTCPKGDDGWRLDAQSITIIPELGWGETKHAILRVGDVPVLYIPYLTFPTDNRRSTGFLYPKLSSSARLGADIQTPFYWNLAENYDLTITPRMMSKRGIGLNNQFRYLGESSEHLFAVDYLNSDREYENGDERRYAVHYQQSGELNERWQSYVDVNDVSDDNYLVDFGSDYVAKNSTNLIREARLNYLGDTVNAQFQLIGFETLGEHQNPYKALPYINLQNSQALNMGPFSANWSAEYAHFQRSIEQTDLDIVGSDDIIGQADRLHIEPNLRYELSNVGWEFTADAALLHTRYQQQVKVGSQFAEHDSRTLPKLRLHGQLNFERYGELFDSAIYQTLQPQLQYLYVPKRDQQQLGLFDTTLLQDDFYGLFRDRRYTGLDRVADANQITFGATTRIYNSKNNEIFNLSAGQIFYLSSNDELGAEQPAQDVIAAETMWHWHSNWYLHAGIQYDLANSNVLKHYTTLDYRIGEKTTAQLNHRYTESVSGKTIEQAGIFAATQLDSNWYIFGSYHRDMRAKNSLEYNLGLQYESCCWALRMNSYRHIQTDFSLQSSTGISGVYESGFSLTLILNGLSGDSSVSRNNPLSSGIFGYRQPYYFDK